jgi:glycosyltransferase involved in cell wall biosynthesis
VASAVGGLRETIVEGQTGWSYPAGDPASLARCIKEVLANPDEALRRATNGRSMVIARYDRRLVFARLAQVIGATLPKLID